MSTYSRYWRINCSQHEATELALGLRALRKVAGSIGRNVKPIFWKGMAPTESAGIFLDPGVANGKYPIPVERFDLLTGRVIHDALSSLEWREWVTARVREAIRDVPGEIRGYTESFVQAAEDIYVTRLAVPRAWSLYLSNLWRTELMREVRDARLPPSAASLAQVWRGIAIVGKVPEPLHHYYFAALERLAECAREMTMVASLRSLGERRDERVRLYLQTWSALRTILSEWETGDVSRDGVSLFDEAARSGDAKDATECEEAEQKGRELECACSLDPDVMEEVNALLEEGEVALTRSIIVALEDPEAGSMQTVVRRGVARTNLQPDPIQVRRLKRIFREQEFLIRRARRRRMRRGVLEGKLDARRLHRTTIDGKVFRNRQSPGSKPFWQICVVADASSSMTGMGTRQKPWPTTERALASLTEAAKGSGNVLDIYAYHEEKNRCTLTQLYHGGQFYTVTPAGRTPSGQSILGAAMMSRKGLKKRMIIHVTDGASNCGVRLRDAIDYCNKSDIELFTIGCGCSEQTRDFLKACFPPQRLYFMESINGLAHGFERLLRRNMLGAVR